MERYVEPSGSERKQLLLALRACEARFRNTIEKNADGVIVVRRDGMIGYVNPAASRLLERPADSLIGEFFGIPIVPGETTEIDIPLASGEIRIADLRVVETEWEGEDALLVSLRDVSDRKRLEEQLRLKADQLAEADRRKDEFLAMLAHELRNPLAPILNAAHVMKLRADDPAIVEQMRCMVERQVRSMARLVDDLLDVSRITRGKIQLRKEPVNLSAVIQRAVETTRPLFHARDQPLCVDVPDPPIRLQADPMRLEQIVINLLNNASKYSEPGSPVSLDVMRQGDDVVVRVRDHGIGIDGEMMPRVFDLFAQAEQTLDRAHGGLGIGLTLVRSLAQMHGGVVTCRSDGLGFGSEFLVRLPIVPVDVVPEPPPPLESPSAPGRPLRVLVIDDNVHAAESLALIVKLWGHESRLAHDGPEALEVVEAFQPEVVLLDIGLPGMDGYAVGRRIRQRPAAADSILLIAITGYGRDEDRSRSREAGFDHHLVKPLDLDELEALLARHRSASAPPTVSVDGDGRL